MQDAVTQEVVSMQILTRFKKLLPSGLRKRTKDLKLKNISENSDTNYIHIHEDDYGMCYLFPLIKTPHFAEDVQKLEIQSTQNSQTGDEGWLELGKVSLPTVNYYDTDLNLDRVKEIAAKHMPPISNFYSTASSGFDLEKHDPYGSYETDVNCFGFQGGCYLLIKVSDEGHITDVFFDFGGEGTEKLIDCIKELNKVNPLMIIDEMKDIVGVVSDKVFLRRYFGSYH